MLACVDHSSSCTALSEGGGGGGGNASGKMMGKKPDLKGTCEHMGTLCIGDLHLMVG